MVPAEILNADGTAVRMRRLRKRPSVWTRGKALLAPVSVAIAIPLAAILILQGWTPTTGPTGDDLTPVVTPSGSGSITATAAGTTRVAYPYSIVPGRLHSADDAGEAVASDLVIARHSVASAEGDVRSQGREKRGVRDYSDR
ncbi:MAG: hypothetical protein ABJA98_31665 [Acidobacteriota bacterium]